MKTLGDHVAGHPVRLLFTVVVVAATSWTLAGWALIVSLDSARNRAVEACRDVNELRRDLYIAAADLGVPKDIRARFLPSENCERLK